MAFWLFKSEPGAWSWDDHVRAGVSEWDGVRNHQANNFMKVMRLGERGFFYHSGDERRIVGVVGVVKEWHLDPSDKWAASAWSNSRRWSPPHTQFP